MQITSIEIKNFRGFKEAIFNFPVNQRIICIIGSGDSGKSTLLTAIQWALWPAWNLSVNDTDFYCGKTQTPISISVTLTEIPEALINEEKYGLYLRNAIAVANGDPNDEPIDGGILAITIRLMVDDTLEPKWEVITNRTEPKGISSKDRLQLGVGIVGFDYEKDFLWGRNSILQKYANSKDILHDAYKRAMRSAVEAIKLSELDQMAEDLKSTGMQYGVSFNGEIHNKIIMQNGTFSTAVGVFDGDVPFVQRGLGSKRLLSMGMNINTTGGSSVLLIDEIETGLEPYRICGLINEFRRTHKSCGQVIFTTHSQNVITECSIGELSVINTCNGISTLTFLETNDRKVNGVVQSILRTDPASFLCKRLIVCEGKTEMGFLKAIDNYLMKTKSVRFSYFGVGIALGGGGDKMFTFATLLKKCGYGVSILMDSDEKNLECKKMEAKERGIDVFDWDTDYSIENQVFADAPVSVINKLLLVAIDYKSIQHVTAKLKDIVQCSTVTVTNDTISVSEDVDRETIKQIGNIAKKCEWYKRIALGIDIGEILLSQYDSLSQSSTLYAVIENIKAWVMDSE